MKTEIKFHFITVVWGKEFTELYLDTVLPTQLSSGNIFSLKDYKNSIYKIYSTEQDLIRIKKSDAFIYLKDFIKVELIPIGINIDNDKRYLIMTECHKEAIESAKKNNAILVFLSPDAIFSDGTFSNITEYAKMGKRAVMIVGLRVTKETFIPALKEKYFCKNDKAVALSSRDLMRLALKNLHPISKSLIWNDNFSNTWPSHIYWDVNSKGILVRAFHMHPLMVNPSFYYSNIKSTIDGDFLLSACPDLKDIHIVTDSDEMLAIEISPLHLTSMRKKRKLNAFDIALWAKHHANSHHRNFFLHKIRLHTDDDLSSWKEYEKESDRIVDLVFLYLKFEKILCNGGILKSKVKRTLIKLMGEERLNKIKEKWNR